MFQQYTVNYKKCQSISTYTCSLEFRNQNATKLFLVFHEFANKTVADSKLLWGLRTVDLITSPDNVWVVYK